MIEFSLIAECQGDAHRSARKTEGKADGFASALDDAVRTSGDEREARAERPRSAPTDNACERHAAPAPQSDEPVADGSDGQPANISNERDNGAARAALDADDGPKSDGEPATAVAPAPGIPPVPDKRVATMSAAILPEGAGNADSPGEAGAVKMDEPVTATEPADGILASGPNPAPQVEAVDGAAIAVTPNETATNITTTAGEGEAPASAAETAPPAAAQDMEVPANPTGESLTKAQGLPATLPNETTAATAALPATPGTAAPPEQVSEWAAGMAPPPSAPVAEATAAAKSADPATQVIASGKPVAVSGNAPVPLPPDATAQSAKLDGAVHSDKSNGAPASAFAQALANSSADDVAANAGPKGANTAQAATANGAAAPGQTAAQLQSGADAALQAQAASAPSGDQPPSAQTEPRPAATGTPQLQPGTPSSPFANEIRIAADLSPTTQTAAGRTASSAAAQQLSFQIGRSVQNGHDRFTLELKPADLGRVSVKMEIGFDNRVIAVISADRADTLDLLQRDARVLERALQDSGLKTDSGSLSFNLRGDGAGGNGADADVPARQHATINMDDDLADALGNVPTTLGAPTDGSGINIQV